MNNTNFNILLSILLLSTFVLLAVFVLYGKIDIKYSIFTAKSDRDPFMPKGVTVDPLSQGFFYEVKNSKGYYFIKIMGKDGFLNLYPYDLQSSGDYTHEFYMPRIVIDPSIVDNSKTKVLTHIEDIEEFNEKLETFKRALEVIQKAGKAKKSQLSIEAALS